ncbi:nucleotidyltransferase [Patescibacteria group bacterium]|nr:nucleotidyltransferase [Patescibacteria group bacterium]
MKTIAHIDADCFYVSCERVRDSSLCGRPVGVLGNQGACVIARSYEMKERGITVATPIWKAKKICPDGIYVKRDFAWYGAVSKAMHKVLRRYSDVLEFYSVDECFLDLTGIDGSWEEMALSMQRDIKEEVGIPVSIGIAPTRSLAKIGSDKNKPFGISVVDQSNLDEFLKTTPVEEICGVGRRLRRRLHSIGVRSCLDYVRTPRRTIKKLLFKPGEEVWYELQGKSLLPVRTVRPQRQVVSRGGQIPGHSSDKNYIFALVMRNLERLLEALLRYELEILKLQVVLQKSRDKYYSSLQVLPDYSSEFDVLAPAVRKGFDALFNLGASYGAIHLIGAPVRSVHFKQLNLFDHGDQRKRKIYEVKHLINAKFGMFALRSATTADANEIFRDKNSDHEICDIEGKFCF